MRSLFALMLAARAAIAAEVNGYAESRSQLSRARVQGLLPTHELPQLLQLVELNTQVRHAYVERGFFYGDLSLLLQVAGSYRGLDAQGAEVGLPDRDLAQNHPVVSLNELYASHEVRPALHVLLGKKRVVWGSGLAFNPTDLFNPRKDPTDPTFQRAGAWMASIEAPLESVAFTFAASPAVLRQDSGLPYQLLLHPSWDVQDSQYHYLLAARAYALVRESDLNLMLFFGNRYGDDFENKLRVGASFSRYFFTDYELHVEALVQAGSTRAYVRSPCVESALAALQCQAEGTPFASQALLDDGRLVPKVLLGARTQLADESMLSLEYLYQGDGFSRAQMADWVSGLDLLRQARELGVPSERLPSTGSLLGGAVDEGVPQKFSFEPLGRHYLFATFQKPKIRDDFTVSASLVASLTDLSSMLAPSVSWSAREWLQLSLFGFLPLPGPRALATTVPRTGEAVSEHTLLPVQYRALFSARVFY
ncbi:MAG: hypothetical protein ACOZIN_00155 [Myxococcota bacterium]